MTNPRIEELKNQARNELYSKGYVIDSLFKGDYETWMGVYARPKDKPTACDPKNNEEAEEQEKYMIAGCVQDFSEWFDWSIVNGKLLEE